MSYLAIRISRYVRAEQTNIRGIDLTRVFSPNAGGEIVVVSHAFPELS
jgi:hypothetical protein